MKDGISVLKKNGTDYRLYYYIYHLSDEESVENNALFCEAEYGNILGNGSVIELEEGDCVCLIEKENDVEVERYELYCRKSDREGRLECRISRAFFWGKRTWKIFFSCDRSNGEKVGGRHFRVCYQDRQFAFPKDVICVKGKKNRKKSVYFISLPEGVNISDVYVSADDVVQGKYIYNYRRK